MTRPGRPHAAEAAVALERQYTAVKAKVVIISLVLIGLAVAVILLAPSMMGQRKGMTGPQGPPPPAAPRPPHPTLPDKGPPDTAPPTVKPPDSADSCPVSVVGTSDRTVGGSGPLTFTVNLSVLSAAGDEFDILYNVVEMGSGAKVDTNKVLKQYDEHHRCRQSEGTFEFRVDSRPVDAEHKVTIRVRSHIEACTEAKTTLHVAP